MRFSDPALLVPDVVVESKAAGFDAIGNAVFGLLSRAIGRMRDDRLAPRLPVLSDEEMRAAFYVRRGTHRDSVYVQGKWRPHVGGVLFITTASNWGAQVARPGHAVLDGHPVVHVAMRDSANRPLRVWVIDVVATHLAPHDTVGEPVRVYFGARAAEVRWTNGEAMLSIDHSRTAEGALPVPMFNAVSVASQR